MFFDTVFNAPETVTNHSFVQVGLNEVKADKYFAGELYFASTFYGCWFSSSTQPDPPVPFTAALGDKTFQDSMSLAQYYRKREKGGDPEGIIVKGARQRGLCSLTS